MFRGQITFACPSASEHTPHSQDAGLTLSICYVPPGFMDPGCWALESKIPHFTSDRDLKKN